jgi:hypothetical protein
VKLFAGCGKGPGLGNGPDDFKLPQIHADSLHVLNAWIQGVR